MTDYKALLEDHRRKLLKALKHLNYSFKKIQSLPSAIDLLDDESLETWEGFSARFSRVADIFLSRYLRTFVLMTDPGSEGTLRDFVNKGEKLGVVDDANAWMEIRALRNISAHGYSEEELAQFFERLKAEVPRLIALEARIK